MGPPPQYPKEEEMPVVNFDVAEFLEANRIVSAEGGGLRAVADLLGVTCAQVANRRFLLKKKGITLPRLRGRGPAAKPVVRFRKTSGKLHFTITVGG